MKNRNGTPCAQPQAECNEHPGRTAERAAVQNRLQNGRHKFSRPPWFQNRESFQSGRSERESCGMAGASSRVQRVFRTEKTSGAVRHTACARWNTLCVQNGEPFQSGRSERESCGMAGASSRVQRVFRTEKISGAMKHAARAERRTLSEQKIREGKPQNGRHASRVQRVFRTEKTSGAMKHAARACGGLAKLAVGEYNQFRGFGNKICSYRGTTGKCRVLLFD